MHTYGMHVYIYICICVHTCTETPYLYLYVKKNIYIYIYIYVDIFIYGHALRGPHPPKWSGKPPPFCGVGCGGVDWESPSLLPSLWCGVWWVEIPLPSSSSVVWGLVALPPSPSVVWGLVGGNGGVEFVLGSLGEVESVVLPEWGLLALVKLLQCTKPYSVREDFGLRLWDVRFGVSSDLGDSC